MDLYQVCSNYAPCAKNGPVPGVTCFTSIGLYRENMKKSSCLKPQELEPYNIWYIASPSRPLSSLFKLCPCCQKMGPPRGSHVLHRLTQGKPEKDLFIVILMSFSHLMNRVIHMCSCIAEFIFSFGKSIKMLCIKMLGKP